MRVQGNNKGKLSTPLTLNQKIKRIETVLIERV